MSGRCWRPAPGASTDGSDTRNRRVKPLARRPLTPGGGRPRRTADDPPDEPCSAPLRSWLDRNHATSTGVWLASYRKSTGNRRLEYTEIVEALLCFGWIDSRPNALDDERSLLWISPRKPASGWSRITKQRIAKLERAGRLTDAGRSAVAVAKRNGAWSALDSAEALESPADP